MNKKLEAMKMRVGNNAKQAVGVGKELISNFKKPGHNLAGTLPRLIRGGPADALLNTDTPNLRLSQKQIGAAQKAALPDHLAAASYLAGAGAARKVMASGAKATLKNKSTGKFMSRTTGLVGTLAGIGAIAGTSAVAAAMIDRSMKKTFGTGLKQNVKEGIKKPVKNLKGGVKFLKENVGK